MFNDVLMISSLWFLSTSPTTQCSNLKWEKGGCSGIITSSFDATEEDKVVYSVGTAIQCNGTVHL